jgi:hypothetical protein
MSDVAAQELIVPTSQEEVTHWCRKGVQWCHICEDVWCGDNLNSHQ